MPTPTMQSFDKSTLVNVGDSATLKDTRDGNFYTVKKLADGNVWMTQNLRIIDKTISSADSNLPSGETYTVPASDVSAFTTDDGTSAAYIDSTHGGYYNFYTVTAGWGTNNVTSDNSPKDICPKGWRLPTGGPSGEFQTLYDKYNSKAFMQGEPNLTPSGYVDDGFEAAEFQDAYSYFWSSTVNNNYDYSAHNLFIDSSDDVYPTNFDTMFYGLPARCIAQ